MTITKAIQIRSILTRLIGLLFGSMVYSAGLNLFLVPNSIIDGGVVGISLILAELTKISFSVWIILLNAPFFYIGFRRLGLNMALSSSFAVMVLSFWSKIFSGCLFFISFCRCVRLPLPARQRWKERPGGQWTGRPVSVSLLPAGTQHNTGCPYPLSGNLPAHEAA